MISSYRNLDSIMALYQIPELVIDGEKILYHALYGDKTYEQLRKFFWVTRRKCCSSLIFIFSTSIMFIQNLLINEEYFSDPLIQCLCDFLLRPNLNNHVWVISNEMSMFENRFSWEMIRSILILHLRPIN
jgi:hypothetical protein